jgi:GntR family transcriptional regulator/MocR family aminotransferase
LAPEHVAYLGTTSKTIAPGLSVGWMALPHQLACDVAELVDGPRSVPSVFVQAAYASLLERGSVDRHVRRMRRTYRARRDQLIAALRESLPGTRISGASAGFHLLLWLDEDLEERAVADACADEGVRVDTLHDLCTTSHQWPPALILGYGQIDARKIPAAVRAIKRAVARSGRPEPV